MKDQSVRAAVLLPNSPLRIINRNQCEHPLNNYTIDRSIDQLQQQPPPPAFKYMDGAMFGARSSSSNNCGADTSSSWTIIPAIPFLYPILFLAGLLFITHFAWAFVTRRDAARRRHHPPPPPLIPPPPGHDHHHHCCIVCNAPCLPAAAALMARSNSFLRRVSAAAALFPPPSPTLPFGGDDHHPAAAAGAPPPPYANNIGDARPLFAPHDDDDYYGRRHINANAAGNAGTKVVKRVGIRAATTTTTTLTGVAAAAAGNRDREEESVSIVGVVDKDEKKAVQQKLKTRPPQTRNGVRQRNRMAAAAAATGSSAADVEVEEEEEKRNPATDDRGVISKEVGGSASSRGEGGRSAAELAAEDGRRWARRINGQLEGGGGGNWKGRKDPEEEREGDDEEDPEDRRRGGRRKGGGKRRRRRLKNNDIVRKKEEVGKDNNVNMNMIMEEDWEVEEEKMEKMMMKGRRVVACSECQVGKARLFRSVDALHQHQWDAAEHVKVCKWRTPIFGCSRRPCSLCNLQFTSAAKLHAHFLCQHPLIHLSPSNWQHVAVDFRSDWKKPTVQLGEVVDIFKVYNPGWRRKAFEDYRIQLKYRASSRSRATLDLEERSKILRDGNEVQLYHGTTVKCTLGQCHTRDPSNMADSSPLCNDPECSLCRILEVGFKTSKCKISRFQRFGTGIYCSSVSSKSNDYVRCSFPDQSNLQGHPTSPSSSPSRMSMGNNQDCKVMIVCKVLIGRVYRSTQNISGLTAPPDGFDSVQGVPGPVLNYDEIVVYDDCAILPHYIIIYTTKA